MDATISIVLSVSALIVSTVLAVRQVSLMRHNNALPVLIDMFREFRSPEFRQHRIYIVNRLRSEFDPAETGLSKLPELTAVNVLTVCHFFDNLGVLVAARLLDEKLVMSFMGDTIESLWLVLEPYIRVEREFRGRQYQEFFEDLAVRARIHPPSDVRRKLRLRKMK